MTITFACPKCGREIRVRDEAAGKKGRCNGCQNSIVIPAPPLTGELITAPMPAAVSRRSAPPRRVEEYEAPEPRQQPAPNIVVNVSQHAQATAIAGGGGYSNGWAKAALLVAVLSLLVCWIPFLGTFAFLGVGLAGLLCFVGFLAAIFRGGRGLATTIGAALISAVAAVGASMSTVASAAALAKAAAEAAEKNRPRRPAFERPVAAPKTTIAGVVPAAAMPVAKAEEKQQVAEPEPVAEPQRQEVGQPKATVKSPKSRIPARPTLERANLAKAGLFAAAERKYRQVIESAWHTGSRRG